MAGVAGPCMLRFVLFELLSRTGVVVMLHDVSVFDDSWVCTVFCYIFFFFQAEDGIRDLIVTGVQTCALPICDVGPGLDGVLRRGGRVLQERRRLDVRGRPDDRDLDDADLVPLDLPGRAQAPEIGRASCRGRV